MADRASNLLPPESANDPRRIPTKLQAAPRGIYNAALRAQDPWYIHAIKNLMGDPGLSPMGLGVVAGSAGGDILARQLLESESQNPTEAVINYMRLKYPKLMGKVPGGVQIKNLPAGVSGQYVQPLGVEPPPGDVSDTVRRLYAMVNTPREAAIEISPTLSPREAVETLGHELTHGGIQQIRTPELIGREYVFPQESYELYRSQPAEVNARRGGATAHSTFQSYLNQYSELRRLFGLEVR